MNELEELRTAGDRPLRHAWIVRPIRRVLFPFLRPYLLAIVRRAQPVAVEPARVDAVAARVAALEATVTELSRVVRAWGVENGDLRAIGHRLADLEDELIALKDGPPPAS